MKTVMTVIVRWPGKTRGAIGFALIFLLHFLHQGVPIYVLDHEQGAVI